MSTLPKPHDSMLRADHDDVISRLRRGPDLWRVGANAIVCKEKRARAAETWTTIRAALMALLSSGILL